MGIPTNEQETTINFSRNEDICSIWTCDSTMITKLDKLYKCHHEHISAAGEVWAKEYQIPKGKLSFRALSTATKKELSVKQLAVLKKMHEQRRQNQFITQ